MNLQLPTSLLENGVFTRKDAALAGLSPMRLTRLVQAGVLERIESGIYWACESTAIDPADIALIAACLKFGPSSVIGLMTALFRYGLTEEVPNRVWVLIPITGPHWKSSLYKIVRTRNDLTVGIIQHHKYRSTNLERTLVESLQFSPKLGLSMVYKAFHAALEKKMTNEKLIYEMAKQLRLETLIHKHWDSLTFNRS